MIIPRNDKEEFEFYSKFFRNFHLKLTDDRDKQNVILWYKKLRNDQDSLVRIKKEYLKLLLFLLQRKKIISPFSRPPKSGPLPENLDQLNLTVIAKKLCERKNSSREYKKKLHRTADTSGDNFAVFQQVPRWGIHGYICFNKGDTNSKKSLDAKINNKNQFSPKNSSGNTSNGSRNDKNPFKMLLSGPETPGTQEIKRGLMKKPGQFSSEKNIPKSGKTVTFADTKGLAEPYSARSRQGQGVISSTTFLNSQESNTTQLEREIQIENLTLSENNTSSKSSSRNSNSTKRSIMSKKSSTIKNGSGITFEKSKNVLEQLYYSSQCDTNSQKSESLIIEEIVDKENQDDEGSEKKDSSTNGSSKNSILFQKQKSRNYYSLNDLHTLKNELSKILENSESKFRVSRNEIRVLNKKTYVIKTKMVEEVKTRIRKFPQQQVVQNSKIDKDCPNYPNEVQNSKIDQNCVNSPNEVQKSKIDQVANLNSDEIQICPNLEIEQIPNSRKVNFDEVKKSKGDQFCPKYSNFKLDKVQHSKIDQIPNFPNFNSEEIQICPNSPNFHLDKEHSEIDQYFSNFPNFNSDEVKHSKINQIWPNFSHFNLDEVKSSKMDQIPNFPNFNSDKVQLCQSSKYDQIFRNAPELYFDENQYFDIVDFSKKNSNSLPTTWIRCNNGSRHKNYVMRTYPTESCTSFVPRFINNHNSSQNFSKSNPEMEELLSILDSIKQDIHSAQDIKSRSKNFITNSKCS